MFEVIPAIDVMGGRLVRMRAGDPGTLQAFSGDPLALAERFAEQGARWIHFVDLDAAFGGAAANRSLLARIAELPVRVQAGGGLSPDEAAAALDAGAARAIVGSGSLEDRAAVEAAIAALGERVAVGLDVRGERIVPRGSGIPGPDLAPTVEWLTAAGCPRIVHTDVRRDGSLAGPDLEGLRGLRARFPGAVLASGGVRSVDDLHALAALDVEGAIVGRAVYENGLDLAEVLRAGRAD